jgi:hypothetical protein
VLRIQKITLSLIAGAVLFAGVAAIAQKQGVPEKQDKVALGTDEVKQLLTLMDTDRSGKISKKEFMDFMSAEFDRLDKDHSGELDAKELINSAIRPAARPSAGK